MSTFGKRSSFSSGIADSGTTFLRKISIAAFVVVGFIILITTMGILTIDYANQKWKYSGLQIRLETNLYRMPKEYILIELVTENKGSVPTEIIFSEVPILFYNLEPFPNKSSDLNLKIDLKRPEINRKLRDDNWSLVLSDLSFLKSNKIVINPNTIHSFKFIYKKKNHSRHPMQMLFISANVYEVSSKSFITTSKLLQL